MDAKYSNTIPMKLASTCSLVRYEVTHKEVSEKLSAKTRIESREFEKIDFDENFRKPF